MEKGVVGRLALPLLLVLAVAAVALTALGAGEAKAMSNGAPQIQCVQCHADAANNPADFVVEGLPETYEPGREYEITIRITKGPECPEGASCGGFAVMASAGELIAIDEQNTFVVTTPTGEKMLTHTKQGSTLREWKFRWKAPESPVEVDFKIAVIAANGDGSFNGDAYGFREVKIKPAEVGPVVTTITETVTKVTYVRTPTATVVEYNAGLAAGVAAAIFVIVVLAYMFIVRR